MKTSFEFMKRMPETFLPKENLPFRFLQSIFVIQFNLPKSSTMNTSQTPVERPTTSLVPSGLYAREVMYSYVWISSRHLSGMSVLHLEMVYPRDPMTKMFSMMGWNEMQVGTSFKSKIFSGSSLSMFHKITLQSKLQVIMYVLLTTTPRWSRLIYQDKSTISYSCSTYWRRGFGSRRW